MNNFKLITEHSPWFILLCFLAGIFYAFLLYSKKTSWGKNFNFFLATLRGCLVTILTFLLLGPLIKHYINKIEQPSVVIALDNSLSVAYATDSTLLHQFRTKINEVANGLINKNTKVEIRLLDQVLSQNDLQSFKFSSHSTDLGKLINDIQLDYTNRNLAGIILATDGLYNEGINPSFINLNVPVHTIGLGDTIPQKDINLKSLLYNRITYSGNKFPIVAEVHQTGFKNQTIDLVLKKNNKVIDKKKFRNNSDKSIEQIEFQVASEKNGLQHYTVEVEAKAEEFSPKNNIQHAYIEVIEGKEKILLLAAAPHPDLKAIRSAIEKKQNYQLELVIPGMNEYKPDKYDLVIFHQIPDRYNSFREIREKLLAEGTSALYILGNQSELNSFNALNKVMKITPRQDQVDQVTPGFNKAFEHFSLEEEEKEIIKIYPPVSVPFGSYELLDDASVIFFQQVGSLITAKPLIAIKNSVPKSGVIAGDGIWQWSLQEYRETKGTKAFDKLITSIVQYLSTKEDKRKFRFYPVSQEFMVSDQAIFETEIYNDIYERIFGQTIDLNITDEKGEVKSYSFINSEKASRFSVKGLHEGTYKYVASTTISNKTEKVSGEFSIKDLNLEAISTTADHELLKNLSSKTGGTFQTPMKMDPIVDNILSKSAKNVIHTTEEYDEIINLPWIFFLLVLLVSAEWFIRKYKGSY